MLKSTTGAGPDRKGSQFWRVWAPGIAIAVWFTLPIRALGAPPMVVPGQFNVSGTGAATYSIPINVPPGTGGMVPGLALSYSSRSGDGIVGLGWALIGLSSITRCPRTNAQDSVHGGVNYDSDDRFCLDGQRLMVISGTYGANNSEYRTEVDNFTKVIAHTSGANGPDYFEVHTRNGLSLEFGNTTDSHVLAVGTSIARAWAVDKIVDSTGNYLTVTYNCTAVSSACTDSSRTAYGELYPLRVDYTGNAGASVSPYNSVQFVYDTRPDITPKYEAGSLQQLQVRLTDVKTYQGANLVYDYQLAYDPSSATIRSRLLSVTLCDGSSHCLAPTTFGWQGGTALPTMTATTISLAQGESVAPGDYMGNGLTDVMVGTGANCGIWQGSNTLSFSASGIGANYTEYLPPLYNPNPITNAAACFDTTYTHGAGVPSDFQGDGYSDVVMKQSIGSVVYVEYLLNNTAGTLAQAGGNSVVDLPTVVADFNGDGRADTLTQISIPTGNRIDFSNGDGTFTAGTTYAWNLQLLSGDFDGDGCRDILRASAPWTIDYSCHPKVASKALSTWTDATPVVGDFNGDGLQDILLTYTGSTGTLNLSTGNDFASTGFTVPSGWANYNIVVGDWNGDGKDDIALISPGSSDHEIWLSTGTGFVSATTIAATSSGSTAIVADWNNDGADGFWLQRASGDAIYTFAHVPELMTTVSNGIGATVTITYDRINKNGSFYTKGSSASYPVKDLDGPLYAVSQVATSDGLGGTYTATYAYGGAQTDLSGRGFLGFATVKVTDGQTNIVQTTAYNTAFPYTGTIATQTAVHSGTTLRSISNTFHDDATHCGVTESGGVYFVCLTGSAVSGNDLNGAALPATTTDYSSFDAYGNPQSAVTTVTYGGSTSSTRTVTNTYTNDTTHWILGLLATNTVESVVGSSDLTRHMSFTYDSTTGLLTRSVVEPSNCDYLVQTDYTLDAFGNRTATAVGSGSCSSSNAHWVPTRTATASYDANGTFATSGANPLSQSESWTFNAAFGGPASHTDIDGLTTSWSYDTLGRPTLVTNADGTKTGLSYAFCSGVNGGSASCPTNGAYLAQSEAFASNGTTQIGPIATTYYDALNRVIAADVQGFDGSTIRSSTEYDNKGRVNRASRPYFVSSPPCVSSSPCWTSFTYDDLGRVTRTDFPNAGAYTTASYNGLTISTNNDLSRTISTTLNPQGQNASVTDAANNTTSYTYNAFGNILTVTDAASHTITNVYDSTRGMYKTDSTDPDMGHWTYVSDVLGELKSQTDAKSQTTTLSYDLLGRPTERGEAGSFVSNWVYDGAAHGVGRLQASCTSASSKPTCASPVTAKTFTYDATGRPSSTVIAVGDASYTYTASYNTTNGALQTVTYPSGLSTKNVFNSYGYLCIIADGTTSPSCSSSGSTVFWKATARDAELHLTGQTFGSGVSTTNSFAPETGLMTGVLAGPSNAVANFAYAYDTQGNLRARTDLHSGGNIYEKFCYDSLNRLTDSATGSTAPSACTSTGSGITSKTVSYDAIGNITQKSDVCNTANCYDYGSGAGPHAVTSINATVNGVPVPKYSYDANGNMTCTSTGTSCSGTVAQTVTYNAFNMTASVIQGSTALCLSYDSDHMRIAMEARSTNCSGTLNSTTTYLNDPASGTMSERVFTPGSNLVWHVFLKVDGHIVAQRTSTTAYSAPIWNNTITWGASSAHPFTWTATPSPSTSWAYFTLDNLGSIAVVTDASGSVVERLSYDAWGKRRNSNGTDAACGTVTSSVTTRGYTGHEMLDQICEINANARIYDPTIARFMAADAIIQNPFDGQAFNRYGYVRNNPFSATDPSGYCFEMGVLGGGNSGRNCNIDEFNDYVRSQGGWGGPYWDARYASGGTANDAGHDLTEFWNTHQFMSSSLGASASQPGSGVEETIGDYNANLVAKGINPDPNDWKNVSPERKALITDAMSSSDFQSMAEAIYNHDVPIHRETEGIIVYLVGSSANYDDPGFTWTYKLAQYEGKPTKCSVAATACMMAPDPNYRIGIPIFDFHVHPNTQPGGDYASEGDLGRSMNFGGFPGVIWYNSTWGHQVIIYQAHCLWCNI